MSQKRDSGSNTENEPWYKNGLRFKCSGCGDCCTGAPGYVWVNKDEIENMAATLGMIVEDFEQLYVRKVGVRKSLKELPNYDCIFLDDERRCNVYHARPRQCKTWPFWDSNLKSPETWANSCDICPGSGTGPLVKLDDIERRRKVMKL